MSIGPRAIAIIAIIVALAAVTIFLTRSRNARSSDAQTTRPPTRITSSGNIGHLAVSPDGRFAAYTSYDGEKGQELHVHQIATGSSVIIAPPDPKMHYAGVAFSADSNYVLPTGYAGSIYGSVVEIPLLGGPATPLIKDADTAAAVSPDGTRLAVVRD